MSTNKTENLNLHAWKPDDPFRLDEINENFTVLDGAVHAVSAALTRMCYGSYVGTGTYGAANPTSITFDFEPKVVFVQNYDTGRPNALCWFRDWGSGANDNDSNSDRVGLSWQGNTLSWYHGGEYSNATAQMNTKGVRYYYCALG